MKHFVFHLISVILLIVLFLITLDLTRAKQTAQKEIDELTKKCAAAEQTLEKERADAAAKAAAAEQALEKAAADNAAQTARIEAEKHDIVIKEIHAATDTAKLMDSIESAVNKSRIKISSFHDYTANDQVNIELSLQRGYSPEKAINALYTYTDCQVSVSCTYMVICDNRPVRMSASDILRRTT